MSRNNRSLTLDIPLTSLGDVKGRVPPWTQGVKGG